MKTYYCVTTACYNNGRVVAAITSERQAETMPMSTCAETSRKDIYSDWFATRKEAEAFVEEAKKV